MADIEIQPLTERLSDEEIEELVDALDGAGAPRLPHSFDASSITIAEDVDEDVLEDLLDRLEGLDAACEVYLPMDFEGRIAVGDMMVGSIAGLVDALEVLRDALAVADDEAEALGGDEEEEEDDDEEDVAQLRTLWKLLRDGATEALDRNLPLHIVS